MTDDQMAVDSASPSTDAGDAVALERIDPPPPAAWDMLRKARESKGVHLVAVSSALKVPLQQLQALERGELDSLPDAVFARALVGSVCRHLGVDSTEILEAWPKAEQIQFRNIGASSRIHPTDFETESGVSRWIVGGLALVLCAAAVTWWLGASKSFLKDTPIFSANENADEATVTGSDATSTPGNESAPMAGQVAEAGPQAELDSGARSNAAGGTSMRPVANDVASPNVDSSNGEQISASPMASAPKVPAAEVGDSGPKELPAKAGVREDSPAAPTSAEFIAPPPGTPGLVIHAREVAWVEVKDAQGNIVLSRNMAAGSYQVVQAGRPWTVALGNAPATELRKGGQPVDFSQYAKQGVARFQVD